MNNWVPELLAPAGNLEKLKVAVSYGANAVYLGGQDFGLRSAADNFTSVEILEGVKFAHDNECLVYVVLNSFLMDEDMKKLPSFLKVLEKAQVDAVIVSDLGVVETVKAHSKIPIHLSTQASCLNTYSAKLWKGLGITRVVLGREVSIKEAGKIKRESGVEVEMFIHGSMCMAYSGNCVISNYTQGRDSNRGGCAHSCRFEYSMSDGLETKKAFFMSSKDLEGLRLLEDFIKEGIDSLKVEGRMKTPHYTATISKVYGQALKYYKEHAHFLSDDLDTWSDELRKVSHRTYHEGSLRGEEGRINSVFDERDSNIKESAHGVAGMIIEAKENEYLLLQVRSPFYPGVELELMPFDGEVTKFKLNELIQIGGEKVEKSRPGKVLVLPYMKNAEAQNIIRMIKS